MNTRNSIDNALEKDDDSKGSHVNRDNKSETFYDPTINTEIELYNEEKQLGKVEVSVEEFSQEGTVTDVGNRTIMEQTWTRSVQVSVERNEKGDDNDATLITVGQAENNILYSISPECNFK